MTDDDGSGSGSGSGSGRSSGRSSTAPAPAVELLSVVEFIHADPIDRLPYRAAGVVVAVDEQTVTVRPLADHRLIVPAADVAVITRDDAGEV